MKALLQRFDAFEKRFDQIEEDVKITKDITSEMIQIMDKSIIFETAISEESRAHLLVLQLTARDKVCLFNLHCFSYFKNVFVFTATIAS